MVVGSRPNLKKISDKKGILLILLLMTHKLKSVVWPLGGLRPTAPLHLLGGARDFFKINEKIIWWGDSSRSSEKERARFLKYAKKLLPKDNHIHIYSGIIEQYFSCCSSVWGVVGKPGRLHYGTYKIVLPE